MNREPSNNAHGGMGTMPALYLTPASVSYLNQIILATLISGYLLIRFARRGAETRTSADWQLLAIFVSVILVSAAFFFEVTLLPAGRFVAVVLEIPLTILLLSVLIQFAYAFPHPIGSTLERRLALIFSGLYLAYEIGRIASSTPRICSTRLSSSAQVGSSRPLCARRSAPAAAPPNAWPWSSASRLRWPS